MKLKSLKKSGEIINKGDLLTEIVKDYKALKIYSPISGTILSLNPQLNENPEILNNDPYGKGWVYKIKPVKWIDETRNLYLAEEVTNWSKIEMQRFKDFLADSSKKHSKESSLVILQDGGELIDFPLANQPDVVWHDFQECFLRI